MPQKRRWHWSFRLLCHWPYRKCFLRLCCPRSNLLKSLRLLWKNHLQ
ncbi:MAG: hypothetical protein ACLSHC_16660 [Bilophila wadsworthia]